MSIRAAGGTVQPTSMANRKSTRGTYPDGETASRTLTAARQAAHVAPAHPARGGAPKLATSCDHRSHWVASRGSPTGECGWG